MRRASITTVVGLASAGFLQGCITSSVWDWEGERVVVSEATASEITTWSRSGDEGFRFLVRWSDGRETREEASSPDTPPALLREARRRTWSTSAEAAALVRLAVRRGLVSRSFASDPAFARLAQEPDFQAASVAPLTTPSFSLGPLERSDRHIRLHSDDALAARVALLRARPHKEEVAGRGVVALVASPFTVVLDVATSPFQAVYYVFVILAAGAALGGGH